MKINLIKYDKYVYILSALFSALLFPGCKKLVDIDQPINSVTSATVFSSNAQAASVLAGLYATFGDGVTFCGGLSSDELVPSAGTADATNYLMYTNKIFGDAGSSDGDIWAPDYSMIYNCNSILDGVSASTSGLLTDSVRRQLNGEAKFCRAFSFFYLTNSFGDVPMPLTANYQVTKGMSRTPQAAVYQQIVQDLTYSQSVLPGDYKVAKNERVRPNKWAATAMLARVYLYQQDWKDAETQATAVIGNTQYALSPLTSVFLKNSSETILQIIPSITTIPFGVRDPTAFLPLIPWASLDFFSQLIFSSDWATYGSYVTPSLILSDQLSSSFEPGDQRKVQWTGNTPAPAGTFYNATKYNVMPSQGFPLTQYLMVLRLAEQYLIRAEARAQQGNLNGSASDLNVVRTRAGLAATTASSQAALLTAIAHERQVELFCEWGHRWFDLKRTNQATTVLGAISVKQPFQSSQLLYPIPSGEIRTDPNLTQNPGY